VEALITGWPAGFGRDGLLRAATFRHRGARLLGKHELAGDVLTAGLSPTLMMPSEWSRYRASYSTNSEAGMPLYRSLMLRRPSMNSSSMYSMELDRTRQSLERSLGIELGHHVLAAEDGLDAPHSSIRGALRARSRPPRSRTYEVSLIHSSLRNSKLPSFQRNNAVHAPCVRAQLALTTCSVRSPIHEHSSEAS